MSVATVVFPFIILLLLVCIAIPVFLGVFVYRDAKSRGMEPWLWTLIAILAPSLIGLIIYLIVRRDHIVLSCPSCGSEVQEHFTTCPGCGQKLKAGCPNCGTALKPEWKICPQCGREITDATDFTPPVPNKGKSNKGLVGIIIATILIPLLILMLITFGAIGMLSINTAVFEDVSDSPEDFLSEFMTATETSLFDIMTADDVEILTDENKKWINEKLEDEDGIYSTTIYETESGGFTTADNKYGGDYYITYAYTIIAVNSPEGKAYNFVNTNYSLYDNSLIFVSDPSLMLSEVDSTKADEYQNVFIIKHIYDYNIDASCQDESMYFEKSGDGNGTFNLNISTENGSFDYEIPFEKESSYTAFK